MAVISKREWNIAILQVVLVLVITPGTILVFQPLADLFVDAVDELLSTDPDVFSEFDDSCYMVTQREYKKELLDLEGVFTDDDTVDDDDVDDDDDDDDDEIPVRDAEELKRNGGFISLHESPGLGKPDWYRLGRCRHTYLSRFFPPGGYEKNADFYMHRDGTDGTPDFKDRDRCFLHCVPQLDPKEVTVDMLADAARMNLLRVSKMLMEEYGLDPVEKPTKGTPSYRRPGFNAVQEAIRGGYAELLAVLTNKNLDLVIDDLGRTVRDYLMMRGCAIRPKDALEYMGLDTSEAQKSMHLDLSSSDHYRGWNGKTSQPVDTRCDLPVVDDLDLPTFYYDYFMPGIPFVWKGAASSEELDQFARSRWEQTKTLHPTNKFDVATQGAPVLTNQTACPEPFTLDMLDNGDTCPSTGFTVFRSGNPPDEDEAYPLYEGDPFHEKSVYNRLTGLFDDKLEDSEPNHYFFFGGDEAGVTWHWHNAAFNTCFVGLKQWRLAPPLWRSFTALQSKEAEALVPEEYLVRCTQSPGDMLYLPEFWGHMIINSGFAVGTAMLSNQPLENFFEDPDPATYTASPFCAVKE